MTELISYPKCSISIFKFLLFFLIFFYSPKTYNQTLTVEKIYKKVSGSVVVILAYDSNNKLSSQGSGVVINNKGYIVTNYHVLAGNDKLEILHNKETIPYQDIIGIDVEKDILILKIKDRFLPSIRIGDSKTLSIGQRVYAIGSPLGFENSISEGIISGLRSYDDIERNFIQMTASISPGSSGGAVVNDKGELIGISTLTVNEGQNLNFAVPIDDILKVEIGSYTKNNSYKDFDLFKYGRGSFEKGNYQEAIEYYSMYLEKYQNDAAAYNNRGMAKSRLKDYIGSIQDYNKAIELDPKYAHALILRGIAKDEIKEYSGAMQDANAAIDIDPNYVFAYWYRGCIKYDVKDYIGSIQDYNKAIELDPKYERAYFSRGISKSFLHDKIGACSDWSKAGELGSTRAYFLIEINCK